MRIQLVWKNGAATGVLNDTPTAKSVFDALPASASANTWGEEVYFDLPVSTELADDARQVVDPGTICYWVQGDALALPFGPTPASLGDECRLVTEVNILGTIEGDPRVLETIHAGDTVNVSAL